MDLKGRNIMDDEVKEFFTLQELITLLESRLSVSDKVELSNFIYELIMKNHLAPFIEYKGLVGIVTSYISTPIYTVTETLLNVLNQDSLNSGLNNTSSLYDYSPTLNSIKNLVQTFEHGLALQPSKIESNTHAIFRLSPSCILNTIEGIKVSLGVTKPLAHLYESIDNPIEIRDYELCGYQLYKSKEVNTSHLNLNKTYKILFSRYDVEYFIYSREVPSNIKQKDLLNPKIENKTPNHRIRTQDPKLIAMMAILLSKKSSRYQIGNRPNASAINEDIQSLVHELKIDSEHSFGLKSSHKRIKEYYDDLSQFFNTSPDSNK